MKYDLQLRRGGKLFTSEWSSEDKDYIEREIEQEDLIFHLHDSVCLEKGVKLRDIFLFLNRNVDAFSAVVGCPFLNELIEEGLSDPKINKDKEGIAILELSRMAIMDKNELHFNFSFNGVGEKECYALEFMPVNELALYPVVLNESVSVEDVDDDELVHLEAEQAYTLAELLTGVIDELGFMGPPDVRGFAFEELKKRCEEIPPDGEIDNYRTFTTEDLEKKIKEEQENNKVPCCMCGEDARAQCFGKPTDICEKCFMSTREN